MLNEAVPSRPIVWNEDVAALSFPPFSARAVRDVATGLLAMAFRPAFKNVRPTTANHCAAVTISPSPTSASRHTAMTALRLSVSIIYLVYERFGYLWLVLSFKRMTRKGLTAR